MGLNGEQKIWRKGLEMDQPEDIEYHGEYQKHPPPFQDHIPKGSARQHIAEPKEKGQQTQKEPMPGHRIHFKGPGIENPCLRHKGRQDRQVPQRGTHHSFYAFCQGSVLISFQIKEKGQQDKDIQKDVAQEPKVARMDRIGRVKSIMVLPEVYVLAYPSPTMYIYRHLTIELKEN